MPNIDEAIEALLAYRQADMEGVMVLTSRQAIHEVADELKRLREPARSSAGIETPSDGAIYAAVSQRDVTPEEDAMLRKALIASTEKLYDIPGVAQPSQEQK